MSARATAWVATLALTLAVSACGWRLRGAGADNLADQTVYVASEIGSGPLYRQTLGGLRNLGAQRAASRAAAERILVLVAERINESTSGVDRRGRENEVELRYRLAYRVEGPDGAIWLSRQRLSLSRTYAVDPTDTLAEQGQRALLLRELREEAVGLMLARAARVEPDSA